MKKKVKESGRSMVEMLGVLSIIGLLSVVSIAGYRRAMDNHYANQTVDRLMKRAMIVSSQKLSGQNPDISALVQDGAYEIPNTIDNTVAGKFGLTVNTVPQKVCEKIKAYHWEIPVIIPKGNCEETNNMTFIFNDDLKPNSASISGGQGGTPDTPAQQTCSGVQCGTSCCPVDATCDPNESNKCCIDLYAQGNILCGYEPGELYCMRTDSNGDCAEWSYAAGPNSGSRIIGVPDANGAEASEGDEIYCMMTNSDGQCTQWASCEEGKSSSDLIVGASNGSGQCMYSDDTFLYCCASKQNKDDPCSSYCDCPKGVELTCWDEDSEGNCLEQACVY